MPPTNYARGRAFEYELKKLFEDAGYSVMRGSGSKGEVFGEKTDLVATKVSRGTKKTAHMIIIQCKTERTQQHHGISPRAHGSGVCAES